MDIFMRVIFLTAIKEWLIKKYYSGKNIWKEIAEEMGLGIEVFNNQDNHISYQRLKNLLERVAKKIKKSEFDASSAFFDYWLIDFAPRLYQSLAKSTSSVKDFLLNYVKMNNDLCQFIPNNSNLTKIEIKEIDRQTITAFYRNEKCLVDIIGILRGVSSYFNEPYNVKKLNPYSVEIHFNQ
jgi:hypothetical protein